MTREKIIQGLYRGDSRAIKEAIEALEQEPCEDAISRQSMLDYLKYLHGEMPEEEFVKTFTICNTCTQERRMDSLQ